MAAQFSDPAWWPKPPPAPPKPISPMKIVFGTVVPAIALVGLVIFIVTQSRGHGSSVSTSRSLAAFDSCAKAHGVAPGEQLSGAKGRQVLEACRDKLPPGTQVGSFGAAPQQDTPQQQFAECVQNATAGLPHGGFGGGRFGGRPSSELRSAVSVCRSLVESASGGTTATTPTSTSAVAPPAA